MIIRLKNQQDKLIINERHEAWGNLARKLAHEIKNPLTPIQLTIDRIKEKYSQKIENNEKNNFEENLKIINNQIKQIENLVNEFSDFARMPKPIFKNNDLIKIINDNIKFLSQIDPTIKLNFISNDSEILLESDKEQINRVFLNLIKNSQESFLEMSQKDPNFRGIIDIEITNNKDYIVCNFKDNGPGITDAKKAMTPYFTTKKTGTGLGLPIVTKIINEHSGSFSIKKNKDKKGTLVKITLPILDE